MQILVCLVYLNNPFIYLVFYLLCKKVYILGFWSIYYYYKDANYIYLQYLPLPDMLLGLIQPLSLLCEELWECILHGGQAYLWDLFIAVSSGLRIVHHSKLPINRYYLNEWVNELHLPPSRLNRNSNELRY